MPSGADVLIVLLQLYFMLMNLTVERFYCAGPLLAGDTRFLVPETIAFCTDNNPLFLARPEWMVKATCASAYCFLPGYALIVYAAATRGWERMRVPILLFVGAKLYAIAFYHFMEFTSATPPPHPAAYFAVEGPYLVSIALVLMRVGGSTSKPKRA